MRSPFKTSKARSDMSTPLQASARDAASSQSEKSNAWTMTEREAIFHRRQGGESWETIRPSYPNRSKHAMQQQYSIMKKQALPKTPTKPNRIPRKASTHNFLHDVDGVDRHSKHKYSFGLDGADSGVEMGGEESKSTGKARVRRANSEESVGPKRPNSAVPQRVSKRVKHNTKDEPDSEHGVSEEPVSARPKRTAASGVNYNLLLHNNYFEENQETGTTVAEEEAEEEPKRMSKIVKLRTKPAKTQLGILMEKAKMKNRRTASVDNGHGAPKTPVEKEVTSTQRKSARVKKLANESPANGDAQSDDPADQMTTPRKRKPRILAHLDVVDQDVNPASANDSPTRSSKRKRSGGATDTTRSEPAVADGLVRDEESEQPETKKRRGKQKIKEDLGFLPNGQPRQRRRRRTRQEMLLDQQTPKTVTTRRRGKYHFPYLDGYSGPAPPDMATITARQDELERQNSASNHTSDHDTALSTVSFDEDSSLESSPEPDPKPINVDVNPSLSPVPDKRLSVDVVEQPAVIARADLVVSDHPDTSLGIPEMIFFPEDLAKGRENALKLRASHQAEKNAQLTSSQAALAQQSQRVAGLQQELAENDAKLKTSEAALAQQTQRITEIQQELADQKAQRATSEAALVQQKERVADLQGGSRRIPELQREVSELRKNYMHLDMHLTYRVEDEKFKRESEISALKTKMDEQAREYEALLTKKETELVSTSKYLAEMEAFAATLAKKFEFATVNLPTTPIPQQDELLSPPSQDDERNRKLKSSLSILRNAHSRLAGGVRTTTRSHRSLAETIEKLHHDLEEDEITMRSVKSVAKGLVDQVGRVGEGLEGARDSSDEVKGEVIGLMDRFVR
ncbi:MAG: hypothetical protein Q9216_004912 [Gyalolechia sp. 2 TL-2023]